MKNSLNRAWKIEQHGGPEQLKQVKVEPPEPAAGEALVRVLAVGLNHLDLWVRKGVPGHRFPLPLVPGCDIVGQVEQFGPLSPTAQAALEANGVTQGKRVLVNPIVSCGHCRSCLDGEPALCRAFGILGETQDGGLADAVVVPTQNLIAAPDGLSNAELATLPIAYVTAWQMLGSKKADLRSGQTILIQAAGSGVSQAAIQMAKMRGANVIATAGSADKAERARALGADHVILYREQKVREEVKKIVRPLGLRGVDVALDHVGSDTFNESLKCLDWGGKLVTCGATTGSQVEIDLKLIFFKNLSILGSTMGSKADLIEVLDLVGSGKLKAVIDAEFGFDDVARAMDRLEKRQAFGKVVVNVNK